MEAIFRNTSLLELTSNRTQSEERIKYLIEQFKIPQEELKLLTEVIPLPYTPPAPPVSGTFYPISWSISKGKWVYGNMNSLSGKDGNFFIVESLFSGSYDYIDLMLEFELLSNKFNNMTFNFSGKMSDLRGINFLIINGQSFKNIKYANIGRAGLTFSENINVPDFYVLPDNRIKIRIYCYSQNPFTFYADLVSLFIS